MAFLTPQLLGSFCCLYTATAAFVSTPTSVNATLGSTATFSCRVTTGTTGMVDWLVNGTRLVKLSPLVFTTSKVGHTFFLRMPASKEYNNTNVTCAHTILRGRDVHSLRGENEYSDAVVLRVQGLLSAVSNLVAVSQRDIIRLTWTPPFSLDITGVDLDIWYRVEVYNITNRRVTLTNHSVYVPEFNFNVPNPSPHDQFEFRVTPVNTAGNGTTSHPVSGRFLGIVNCGILTNPVNGQVSHSAGTTFGQTASYSCDQGYNMFGSNTRTCLATGKWSGSEPTCQIVSCGTPISPVNGGVTTFGKNFEQTATYSCYPGYKLVGDSISTCQATGVWSGSAPTCQRILPVIPLVNCGILTNPANGQVSHPAGTTFGQTASYSCDQGYNMLGSNTRSCLATGMWSGSEPTCQRLPSLLSPQC